MFKLPLKYIKDLTSKNNEINFTFDQKNFKIILTNDDEAKQVALILYSRIRTLNAFS